MQSVNSALDTESRDAVKPCRATPFITQTERKKDYAKLVQRNFENSWNKRKHFEFFAGWA
jgi:hypothetical protein